MINLFYISAYLWVFLVGNTYAVETKTSNNVWSFSLQNLTPSLNVPVIDHPKNLVPNNKIILKRIEKYPTDTTVEPFYISVKNSAKGLKQAVQKYSRPGHEALLTDYLRRAPNGVYEAQRNKTYRNVILDLAATRHIKPGTIKKKLRHKHHDLLIDSKALEGNEALISKLVAQISEYIEPEIVQQVSEKISRGEDIFVDDNLLPYFARKTVERFPLYRGPNCFHASVAFQNVELPSLPKVNLRREPDHHRVMINNDELWHLLGVYFYEIDPKKSQLRYGDIITFFDVPKDQTREVANYKWLKHATTYLFNDYVFSKGSKSPNSAYTVKTLEQEWQTWQKFTKNLGVKVFRRSFKHVKRSPPVSRTDWLF